MKEEYQPEIQKQLFRKDKSKFSKYIELFVGKKSIWTLLKYELITLLFSNIPGAIGILLRNIFFPFLFKKVGKNVSFGRNLTLRHPHKISIDNDVVIDDNCMLDAKGIDNNGISIQSGTFIGRNSILTCKNGNIVIEKNVNIGFNSEIFSASNVVIGENTLIAAYVYVIGGDHKYNLADKPISEQGRVSKGITIGKNCWLGAKSLILDGVNVGNDSIIGAGAVVNQDIPPFSIAVGIPARVIKDRRTQE
ncbi:MAG: acyltransferase [Actinobacteria bacterium]|nr:acyltransferase [Actinomycetota bacterium]